MIFGSLKEREKTLKMIETRENFKELDSWQMAVIRGMYWALDCIENTEGNYTDYEESSIREKMENEISLETLEDAELNLVCEILNVYVSFCDDNACKGLEGEDDDI